MSESFVQLEILKLQTDMSVTGHVQQKNNGMTDRDIYKSIRHTKISNTKRTRTARRKVSNCGRKKRAFRIGLDYTFWRLSQRKLQNDLKLESSYEGHIVDALVLTGDEGRDKLR